MIQYVGDVVIYVSSYAVSRFQSIRDEIQRVGFDVARAVYGLPQHYDRCIVVGHSLGSVVAYACTTGWSMKVLGPTGMCSGGRSFF